MLGFVGIMIFMNIAKEYSKEWFLRQQVGAKNSADVIVPILIDLVHPKSVVDVGSGVGVWLQGFMEHGVLDVLGIDGDYVSKEQLRIPPQNFKVVDISKPFETGRKSDLSISLEVGEHLLPESADYLVASLCKTSPVVLFSAAIPHQPGTHHVNGQWPEYWANLFKKHGFVPVDSIRRRVWTNPQVEYWYAQNALIYVKETEVGRFPRLETEIAHGYGTALPLVHPRRYHYALKPAPGMVFRAKRKVKHLLGKLFS